ncbi:MAG: ATP synthase F1 subunit epsilon [Candidatus Pelagibacter sp. TMED272]|nr:ATP synthase F1 subunit epsilon [Pelagibacteraceae bacterium]RPG93665.1 MAG: ATP synthase F1 subunit epsilon [Candidatus Pelagibacter sp. TMED272]|tara:strand:- start:9090 stop:9479 length:390 start_codon:yes stop_codon:yes gene_type:complete
MSDKFDIEIITPSQTILKSETSEVTIPSFEGEMGILKDHISLITFLRPGVIRIKSDKMISFYVEEGTVEFTNNNLLVLTTTAMNLENLDNTYLNESIKKSQEQLASIETSDKEKYKLSYKIETIKEIIR